MAQLEERAKELATRKSLIAKAAKETNKVGC